MANNSTATYDISNLKVARGHDSLKVTWGGFYNNTGAATISNELTISPSPMPWITSTAAVLATGNPSGWTDTSFGEDSEAANQFNYSAGEKIAISVLDIASGVFIEQNKVILSHTDVSNVTEYTLEGLTAGKNYSVNLKGYKTDTSGTLRIYDKDVSGIPYTNPDMLEPVLQSNGPNSLLVTLPGDYNDYFITGLSETGYSALNYISVVLNEEGTASIDISNFVADDTAGFDDTTEISWNFAGLNIDKVYNVRLDYENDTGVVMSTPTQQFTVGSCDTVNNLKIATSGYHDISFHFDAPNSGQYAGGSYQTTLEFKASKSYTTSAAEFKNLPVLGAKTYAQTETPTSSLPASLDLTNHGIGPDKNLLEITAYYTIINNAGVSKAGPTKSEYCVLLPNSTTASPPPMDQFEIIRKVDDFEVSSSAVYETSWMADLSSALYNYDGANTLDHLTGLVAPTVSYTFDFSNNAITSKNVDTSKFVYSQTTEDDETHVQFGIATGASLMGSGGSSMARTGVAYTGVATAAQDGTDYSGNDTINVWKKTNVAFNAAAKADTRTVRQYYEYNAYQVKDREFVDEHKMDISANLTQNQNVAEISWSRAQNPVTYELTNPPYYFVGVSTEALALPTTSDSKSTIDACFNALQGFSPSDKNSALSTTFTGVPDNSYNVIRVRPYYTITNSDNTTDEVSGQTTDISFLPHKFSDIEVQVGVPGKETLQENYPFGADSTAVYQSTLVNVNPDPTADISQVILLKLSGGTGGVEERGAHGPGGVGGATRVSAGAGYNSASNHVSYRGGAGMTHWDMSLNFHVKFDMLKNNGDLSGSWAFNTKRDGSNNIFSSQAPAAGVEIGTSASANWGISGEYYINMPVDLPALPAGTLFDLCSNSVYNVTVTQIITPRDAGEDICSEPTTFKLYTKPDGVSYALVATPEILNDLSGNLSKITGNMDISMYGLSAEYVNSVQLYRDNVLFKTVTDFTYPYTDVISQYAQDDNVIAGSAVRYSAKTTFNDGGFWKSVDSAAAGRNLVLAPLDLKDQGFTNISLNQSKMMREGAGVTTDISFTVKPLPHDMYKHRMQATWVADNTNGRVSYNPNASAGHKAWEEVNGVSTENATNVNFTVGTGAGIANGQLDNKSNAQGWAMKNHPITTTKYIDISYSIDVLDAAGDGQTYDKETILSKRYVINNYINKNPINTVVKAIHTDDDNIPDFTLLAFDRPPVAATHGAFSPLDVYKNFKLTTDNSVLDISQVDVSGGQVIPSSSSYLLESNAVTTVEDVYTSQQLHGESGLDTIITRQHDSGVSINMPIANSLVKPNNMSIIDFGDMSGVLKLTVPSDVNGLILYRTLNTLDGGSVEISGVGNVVLLDISETQLNTTTVQPSGYVATGLYTKPAGVGTLTSYNFYGSNNNIAPAGYFDLSFNNKSGNDYYFWLSNLENFEYGDSIGVRFVYANDGATAVSDLATRQFFSVNTANAPTQAKITNVSELSNKVTFSCSELKQLGTELPYAGTEYHVEIYDVDGVEPNQLNNYNIWDPSGVNVNHNNGIQHQNTVLDHYNTSGSANTNAWKNATWEAEAAKPWKQPITGSSTSASNIVVESPLLSPNKLYMARIKHVNAGVSSAWSQAMAFDMHDTAESPTISAKANIGGTACKFSITVPIKKQNYMHDITLGHKSTLAGGTDVIGTVPPNGMSHILAGTNTLHNRKIIALHTIFDGANDSVHYQMSTRDASLPGSTLGQGGGAARIRGSTSYYQNYASANTTQNLENSLVARWDDTLQFFMDAIVIANNSISTDYQGSFHDVTPPELVVAIHPHWLSDAPIVYSEPLALMSQKVPVLNPSVSLSNDTTKTVERNEVHVGPEYTQYATPTPNTAASNGGPIDTLFMVVEYESQLEEGTVIITRNRQSNDPEWTEYVLDKTFTVDDLPAGAMVTGVTLYAVNEYGSPSSTPTRRIAPYVPNT